jgi:hypothetical protein
MTATTVNGLGEKTGPRWRGVDHLALVTPDMDATFAMNRRAIRRRPAIERSRRC